MDKWQCFEAEAMWRIRHLDVGGIVVGISMLDQVHPEVLAMNIPGENEIADELLKRVKISDYVPASYEEKYQIALLQEYRKNSGG